MASFLYQNGPRTNSLAFAKSDCHTCSALRERCDRQRPRCGTCITHQRACGGFALDLVWKDLAISKNTSFLSQLDHEVSQQCPNRAPQKHSNFKFVQGRPRRKRRPKQPRWEPAQLTAIIDSEGQWSNGQPIFTLDSIELELPDARIAETSSTTAELTQNEADACSNELFTLEDSSFTASTSDQNPVTNFSELNASSTNLEPAWPFPRQDILANTILDGFYSVVNSSLNKQEHDSGETSSSYAFEDSLHLSPGVLYENVAHKYGAVLTMYDEEFCVMPLSWDCSTNPFRVQLNGLNNAPFLLHAILAVSSQHLAKKYNDPSLTIEMYNHRSVAIQAFSEALYRSNVRYLLDTIMVLVNLETTQTASSAWGIHLNGAQILLERDSTLIKYRKDPRMNAQIAMIVWWDVTIALISRKEPRLLTGYLEMLESQKESDGWSFFALSGCPIEFVRAMAHLSKLAAIYHKTTQMEWTIFNREPVDVVINELKSYVNKEDVNLDDVEILEEDGDARMNRFHCIETWRYAILLYAYRVFVPNQDTPRLRVINHLSRLILNNVRCIPRTAVLQKQLLLPVFLAGAEVGDEESRLFVRQYCKHWSETSRFYHFESAAELLEEVWSEWTLSNRNEYWWGVKLSFTDWTQSIDKAQPMVTEFLLG